MIVFQNGRWSHLAILTAVSLTLSMAVVVGCAEIEVQMPRPSPTVESPTATAARPTFNPTKTFVAPISTTVTTTPTSVGLEITPKTVIHASVTSPTITPLPTDTPNTTWTPAPTRMPIPTNDNLTSPATQSLTATNTPDAMPNKMVTATPNPTSADSPARAPTAVSTDTPTATATHAPTAIPTFAPTATPTSFPTTEDEVSAVMGQTIAVSDHVVCIWVDGGCTTGWVYKTDIDGTAWILSDNRIDRNTPSVPVFANGGEARFEGKVIGNGHSDEFGIMSNFAVLRVCCDSGLQALELRDGDDVSLRENVLLVGYRAGDRWTADANVVEGVVASAGKDAFSDVHVIQVYGAFDQVSAGGPIIDRFGKVVGTISPHFPKRFNLVHPGLWNAMGFGIAARTVSENLSLLERGEDHYVDPTPSSVADPMSDGVWDNWAIVVATLGDADRGHLSESQRSVVSEALRVDKDELPDVEFGYELILERSLGDVVVANSGIYTLTFAAMDDVFEGFKYLGEPGSTKIFGRLCRDDEDCAHSEWSDLADYVRIEDFFGRGRRDLAPFVTVLVTVPQGRIIHVDTIAYRNPRRTIEYPPVDSSWFGPILVFEGKVRVNGQPAAESGLLITARIDGIWESLPHRLGELDGDPSRYAHFVTSPPWYLDVIGSRLEFWLEGLVKSSTFSYYGSINEFSGEVYASAWPWILLRELHLEFPQLPDVDSP